MLLQKILKHIRIPNYLLNFTDNASLKLYEAYTYSINISHSYFKKVQKNFYTQFSFISYNPYMFPKHFSNSKKYKDCRKCFFFKYIIIYQILDDCVRILDIFHYKSNYLK